MDFLPKFLKPIAIFATSISLSVLFWYFYLSGEWGNKIVMFWVGVPAGVISGVLFLILNKYLLSTKSKAIQVLTFLLLVALVNFSYYKGGDIWYFITKN